MKFTVPTFRYSLIFLALLFISCTSSEHMTDDYSQHEQDFSHQHHSEQIDKRADMLEMEALYWKRIQESRMNFTQADVDFMSGMIVHHAQALIMSRLAPENEAGAAVQRLAARIINAQDDEIFTMQRWLRDRGQPVPLVEIDGLILSVKMEDNHDEMDHFDMDHSEMDQDEMDHSQMGHDQHGEMDHGAMGHDMMAHHHDMPGMLTQDQLDYLATLRGRMFDKYFLEFMIEHHLGAVYMVDELFAADGAANDTEAFELAAEINAEQITEIERMRLMLEDYEDLQASN